MLFCIFAIAAAVIADNAIGVFGCMCKRNNNADVYCNSDWVSVSKIVKKETPSGSNQMKYTVEHVKQIKRPVGLSSLPTVIMTQDQSASCGVTNLSEGETYLLAGKYNWGKSESQMDTCGQFNLGGDIRWSQITEELRGSLSSSGMGCFP